MLERSRNARRRYALPPLSGRRQVAATFPLPHPAGLGARFTTCGKGHACKTERGCFPDGRRGRPGGGQPACDCRSRTHGLNWYRIDATGWSGAQAQRDVLPNGLRHRPSTDKNTGSGYKYTWQVGAFGVSVFSSETDYGQDVNIEWSMGNKAEQHSLFSYGGPPASQNAQLVFASTEPLYADPTVGGWGAIWHASRQ